MIEILLHGLKMDPLVSLHYYAPVCAAINLLVLPFTEGLEPFYAIAAGGISWGILISNALVAFLLNVAAVFLVSAGSGLVLTLAGVFKVSCDNVRLRNGSSECFHKDILLIVGSVLLFGASITPVQIFGTISLLILTFTRLIMDNRLLCRAVRAHLVQDVCRKVDYCAHRRDRFLSRRHVGKNALVVTPVGGCLQF